MRELVQKAVEAEGLLFLGIAELDCEKDFGRFLGWLSDGKHAEMAFLENHLACRRDPGQLLTGARSAIVLALRYDLGDKWVSGHPPRIAQYARIRDYHRWIRKKGDRIVEALREHAPDHTFRTVVDSAPFLERAVAAKTTRGFIGKNTCYIHPRWGSLLLLGEILTTWPLSADEPSPVDSRERTADGGCGTCDLCQRHCPTGALNVDYTIDARQCLAYWTIEHRGAIPLRFWPHLAKYYFGCDLCQLACPYTRRAEPNLLPADLQERKFPSLFETAVMGAPEYEKYFGGTPLTRAKRNGLRRNALIAMSVTRDPLLGDALAVAEKDGASPVEETVAQIRAIYPKCECPKN